VAESTKNQSPDGYLIQVPNRSLGDFITGLLGQPRSIEKSFPNKIYNIDVNWLLNLDDIIRQRIIAQNEGHLIDFSAKLYFDDGKLLLINSHEGFVTFRDMSRTVSVGADIIWTFLIKFPSKATPEKQEIRFRAFTYKAFQSGKPENYNRDRFLAEGDEDLFYSVQYTDLTWGEDISNHITNLIESSFIDYSRTKKWAQRLYSRVGWILGMVVFVSLFVYFVNPADPDRLLVLQSARDVGADVNTKLDALIDSQILQINSSKYIFIKPFVIVALFYIMTFMGLSRRMSYLRLNDFSNEYASRRIRKYEIMKYGVMLASLVGMLAGIFSNKLYDLLKLYGLL